MGSTTTTYAALLKERYLDSDVVEKLTYPENPLLGRLQKRGDTGMVGSQLPVPILLGLPQGVSGTFAEALGHATNITADEWVIKAGDYYGVVKIGQKVLEASRTNRGAFLENKTTEIDGLYEQAGEALSIYTWGNGGNALGRISTLSTNDIVLTNASDAANFELNMEVMACADDGSSTSHAVRSGHSTVDVINRATGALTITASDITSLTAGDYLFRNGDFYGDQGVIVIKGVQCFITATDSPMELWGIAAATRDNDPQRYAGCRVDATKLYGKSIEQRIKLLIAQMTGTFKAKAPTSGYMHPEDFLLLETELQARGVRALEDPDTKFGYTKIDCMTAAGRLPIYTDRHCPRGTFFAFRDENWWISSMGELLHPQNSDGNEILRMYNSTDLEFRLLSFPLLACNAPKNSGRVTLES